MGHTVHHHHATIGSAAAIRRLLIAPALVPQAVILPQEALAAELTEVGHSSRVDGPLVVPHAASGRESLAAERADVRPLTRVHHRVLFQRVRALELLLAHGAAVRLFAGVVHLVRLELVGLPVDLAAVLTLVALLAVDAIAVGLHPQLVGEDGGAHGALELGQGLVLQHVTFIPRLVQKRLAADVAGVIFSQALIFFLLRNAAHLEMFFARLLALEGPVAAAALVQMLQCHFAQIFPTLLADNL